MVLKTLSIDHKMSIVKPYLVLLAITVVNSELNTVALSNVTVSGKACNESSRQTVHIVSPDKLNEDPTIRSFCKIVNIYSPSTVLPSSLVTDLPKLRSFEIYHGRFRQLQPGTFRNLPNLESMSFNSELEEVEEGVFNDLPVRSLELNGMTPYTWCIKKIAPRAFHNMTNLQFFDLKGSNITRWDINWFQNTPKLRHLSINYHEFEELPERAFQFLRNATDVVVSFKRGSLIRVGDNLFDGLEEIDELDLQHNHIKVFGDGVLKGVKRIRELHLNSNNIKCFSGDLSRIFFADRTIIDYNPIACDADGDCMSSVRSWSGGNYVSARVKSPDASSSEYCRWMSVLRRKR